MKRRFKEGLPAVQADECADALLVRVDQLMYERKKGGGRSSFVSAG